MSEPRIETGIEADADATASTFNEPTTNNAPHEFAIERVDTKDMHNGNADKEAAVLHEFLEVMDDTAADVDKLDLELKRVGHHINSRSQDGTTAVHIAARRGLVKAATKLLQLGADINAQDDLGDTPLDDVCWEGQESIVKLLLEKNARTDIRNRRRWSTLYGAAEAKEPGIVELLSQKDDSTLDSLQTKYQSTALHLAVQNSDKMLTDTLLRYGAKRNIVDNELMTPLMIATRKKTET